LSGYELHAIVSRCPPYDTALRESGHLLVQASLGSARETTTVRPRNGKPAVTDGPFVETKEQVGGFFIIEARDLNEAIRVASKHPAANIGETVGWGIEVRPIEGYEQKEISSCDSSSWCGPIATPKRASCPRTTS
jgi:hypothetical protein